jgi:hypothetical protein
LEFRAARHDAPLTSHQRKDARLLTLRDLPSPKKGKTICHLFVFRFLLLGSLLLSLLLLGNLTPKPRSAALCLFLCLAL